MESSSELMVPILDALSNLNLQSDMLVCMRLAILIREVVVFEHEIATGVSICSITTTRTYLLLSIRSTHEIML